MLNRKKLQAQLHAQISLWIQVLQKFADRIWYPPLISFLAAVDNLILIIPTDGILISSSMLTPKRWHFLAISVAIGSTLGALILASFVEFQGLPWIERTYPGLVESQSWIWTARFFDQYGLLLVFLVALTPVVQQPAVVLATLSDTPILHVTAAVFVGRLIKFLIMAYIGSHAPKFLSKLWGVQGELKEVGIKPD